MCESKLYFMEPLLLLLLLVGSSSAGRIIGGSIATRSERPFQVAVAINDGTATALCGGSIISSRHVLSAAHCARELNGPDPHNDALRFNIIVTDNLLGSPEVVYVVSKVYIHSSYIGDDTNSTVRVGQIDVCIFETLLPIAFSSTVSPITLAAALDYTHEVPGTLAVVSGFGSTMSTTEGNSGEGEFMRKVTVPIVSDATCAAALSPFPIRDGVVCAGGEFNKDSCTGDSGGPLTVGSVLVGVVSEGTNPVCGSEDHYGVYVSVADVRTWIDAVLAGTPFSVDTIPESAGSKFFTSSLLFLLMMLLFVI